MTGEFARNDMGEGVALLASAETELPLDVGASAPVLMAFTDASGPTYEKVRAAGLYVSIGERDPETAAIAAPVFGAQPRLLGAPWGSPGCPVT